MLQLGRLKVLHPMVPMSGIEINSNDVATCQIEVTITNVTSRETESRSLDIAVHGIEINHPDVANSATRGID